MENDRPTVPVTPVMFKGVPYVVEELLHRAGYRNLVQGTVIDLSGELFVLDGIHYLLDQGPTAWSLKQPKGLV